MRRVPLRPLSSAALAIALGASCVHDQPGPSTASPPEAVAEVASPIPAPPEVVEVVPQAQGPEPGGTVTFASGSALAGQGRLRYTTYFYTATEAVVHGYEDGTTVRIVSMETGQPVWAGTIDAGETELVPTGRGVFSFIADRRATILVGTPSSCTAVGYWARDQTGSFRSPHLNVRLPSSISQDDARVVVWAWEDTDVEVLDRTTGRRLFQGHIPAHGRRELLSEALSQLGNHVLQVRAQSPVISVQVYYDEGFSVPASTGRTSGTDFLTYIGDITEGVNDLLLVSYHDAAHVTVRDLMSQEVLLDGVVEAGRVRTLTLHNRYLQVTADREISVLVAPYEHYTLDNYAEHHYAGGAEGTGIDTDFIVPTPSELWLFSYFAGNEVTVEDVSRGRQVWRGVLGAGHAQGLQPGHGLYRVRGTTALSVMGGSQACGAEYSPAGRLFEVDEALLRAVVEIRQQRVDAAAERGEQLAPAAAAAPLSPAELRQATRRVREATGSTVFDESAVQQRIDAMVVEDDE